MSNGHEIKYVKQGGRLDQEETSILKLVSEMEETIHPLFGERYDVVFKKQYLVAPSLYAYRRLEVMNCALEETVDFFKNMYRPMRQTK